MNRSVRRLGWLVFALAGVSAARAQEQAAVDLGYKVRLVGEAHALRGDSPFSAGLPLTDFGRDRGRLEQELRGRVGPLSLLLTGTVSAAEAQRPSGKLLANEAHADFRAGDHHFTLGKKILSGDVGYGFRPIDVIQRELRLQVLPPALEGIPSLAWERYSADAAWSVVLANPGHRRRGDAKSDGSLALRYYERKAGADLHGVARISGRYGLEAGAAVSAVPHESLELHASCLLQQRGERLAPLAEPGSAQDLLAPDRAVRTVTLNAPGKALAGLTWTAENGWSVIAETWWDGSAPTAGDWRALAGQAARRNALPGAPAGALAGSLAASTRLFRAPSASRRALFARLAWTDPAGGGVTASLDVLRTLEDGGWTATAAAAWEGDRLRVDAGLRRFGGKPDSAYGLLPERSVLFAGVTLAF